MSRSFFISIACIVASTALVAQEGHPLAGSWHGTRGPSAQKRTDITVIMDWDGGQLTGMVNPGFEDMKLQNARLNPKGWTVHFEIDAKDASGKMARCVVDGTIDRLGSDQRTLSGSWVCGSVREEFKITRDRDYYR